MLQSKFTKFLFKLDKNVKKPAVLSIYRNFLKLEPREWYHFNSADKYWTNTLYIKWYRFNKQSFLNLDSSYNASQIYNYENSAQGHEIFRLKLKNLF